MIKGFRQIASLTVISRIFGMVRDMAFSHFFGLSGMMDIWTIAFKIPNLARRIFGEGAAASSLIPVYSEEMKKNPQSSLQLARTVVTAVFVILAVIVLLGELGLWWYCRYHAPLAETRQMLTLTGIMLPYMCMICTVAILAGLLNSHRHFAAPAAAPIVLNIIIISSMCIGGWLLDLPPAKLVYILAAGVLTAGVTQLVMQLIPLSKHGVTIRPAWHVKTEAFKKIMLLMGPMILGVTATQINTLADDVIARFFSASAQKGEFFVWFGRQIYYPVKEGSVSSLYFSQRLYQFPLGVLGISLATAIFPVLSSAAADNDNELISKTIRKGIGATFFIALPATAGLILVARPLAAVLYQHGAFGAQDTDRVKMVLIFYSLGLCGYFLQQLVMRAFYSIKDSKWPARTAMLAVLVNVVLNLTLIWIMGISGLALATALCSYLQVVILIAILSKRFDISMRKDTLRAAVKTIIATAIMSAAGVGALAILSGVAKNKAGDILRLAAVVLVSVAVYTLASKLLRNPMLSLVFSGKKKVRSQESK